MPGAVGHHRLVRAPGVARGGDGTDDAPRAGLGHGVARIGRAAALHRVRSLGHAVGRHQEEVILHALVEVDIVVLELGAVVIVVEDEVLAQAEDVVAVLEVLVLLALAGPGAGHLHARPVAAEVVHVAPLVQGDGVPAGLVDDVHAHAVVLGQGHLVRLLRRGEVLGPLVHVDIGPFTGADGELMEDVLVLRTTLDALLDTVEGETVREGLAAQETGRIQVDAPLGGDGLGMGHQVVGIADGGLAAVEIADDVDLLAGDGRLRHDALHEDHVAPGVEGPLFVVELDLLLGNAGGGQGQDRNRQIGYDAFHTHYWAT